MGMLVRYAGIYWRRSKVFIYSKHKMISGALRAQDDAVVVDDSNLEGIGAAVKEKLAAYQEGAPIPRWDLMKGDQSPHLHAAAGVRSSSQFTKGAKMVGVCHDSGQITLSSWKNEREYSGFAPIKDRNRVVVDTASDAEIGVAVIAALADAE